MWSDDRDRQGTLDVGEDSKRTAHRDEGGDIWGSAGFTDDRPAGSDLGYGDGQATQSELFGTSETMDGQADLTGGQATRDRTPAYQQRQERQQQQQPQSPLRNEQSAAEAALAALDVPLGPEEMAGAHTESQSRNNPDRNGGSTIANHQARAQFEEQLESDLRALRQQGIGQVSDSERRRAQQASRGRVAQIEFGSRQDANMAREMIGSATTGRFDGRFKTVEMVADEVDERTLNKVRGIAADGRRMEADRAGQVELKDWEKKDLQRRSGTYNEFKARSVKAIFVNEGVDDWTQYYDGRLSVDEHREVAKRAKRDERGRRMDQADREEIQIQKEARAADRTETEEVRHMRRGAAMGHQEAIDALVNIAGWDRAEAQALSAEAKDGKITEQQFRDIVSAELERSKSSGRIVRTPTRPDPQPGLDRDPRGRYAPDSSNREDAGIGRRTTDGRFAKEGRR